MSHSIHAVVIDGIERPCANCDTTNTHWFEPSPGDCQSYEPALIASTTPAFDAILAQARAVGLPRLYTSDLFRDYQILTGRTGRGEATIPYTFLWTVYDCGTHMVRLLEPSPEGQRAIRRDEGSVFWLNSVEHSSGRKRWFHWSRHLLVEVDHAKAVELAEDADHEQIGRAHV